MPVPYGIKSGVHRRPGPRGRYFFPWFSAFFSLLLWEEPEAKQPGQEKYGWQRPNPKQSRMEGGLGWEGTLSWPCCSSYGAWATGRNVCLSTGLESIGGRLQPCPRPTRSEPPGQITGILCFFKSTKHDSDQENWSDCDLGPFVHLKISSVFSRYSRWIWWAIRH